MGNAPSDINSWLLGAEKYLNGTTTFSMIKMEVNDDGIESICKSITALGDKVKGLRLGSNKITSKGAIKLFRYLQVTPNIIEKLSLAGNRLDDKCMFDLGLLIESNTVLTEIELGFSEFGNDISDDGLKTLSPYLEKNKTLRKVSVSFNKRISDKCLPFIIKALESTQIEEFDVRGTSIVAKNSFFPILLRNSLVNGNRNFEWTWRKLQDDDLIAGCEHLQNFGQDVYNIILHHNEITAISAIPFFKAIQSCDSLKLLDLSQNLIDDECMPYLAEYIKKSKSLNTLNLSKTAITDKGIEALSQGFIENQPLMYLTISENPGVTFASEVLLAEAIQKSKIVSVTIGQKSYDQSCLINASIQLRQSKMDGRVSMGLASINETVIKEISRFIEQYGSNIKYIHVWGGELNSTEANIIFEALKSCPLLERLDFNSNAIGNEGLMGLGELLAFNSTITHANIGNKIDAKGIEEFSQKIAGNTTLHVLDFTDNKGLVDAAVPFLVEIAKTTYVSQIFVQYTGIDRQSMDTINEFLFIPPDQREVPIFSKTKSAKKTHN